MRLDVSYDGTDFAGWAVQPGLRTVAGVLFAELSRILRAPVGLTVAGRTDAGVHATGQVCHVDVPVANWAAMGGSAVRRLAGLLPGDIRVTRIEPAHPDFNARFSALRRRYQYRITDAPSGADPLSRHNTLAWPRKLDLPSLAAASELLLGYHDFAAFCRRRPGATTIRTLLRLDWKHADDGALVATVEADAFCHSMVRSIIGSLIAVGDGRRSVNWPSDLLGASGRSDDIGVAPANGLTLVWVEYPEPERFAEQAELARNRRTL